MSDTKGNATIIGVGVAACAACCAGPIVAVLASIGLGTAAGFALFGVSALVVGAAVMAIVFRRRRRRGFTCAPNDQGYPMSVELTETPAKSPATTSPFESSGSPIAG